LPAIELLEARCLLDGGFRSITGFGNNLANPTWGQSGTDLLRVSPVAYADGIRTPSTPNTLSPREISNSLDSQSDPLFSGLDNLGNPNAQRLSDYAYAWGQFIDHDMDLTLDNSGQAFSIPADPTRPNDKMGIEGFTRSQFDPTTGTSTSNPRQQVNAVTSYLDLSQVYGSTEVVADALRTHSGGLLKTSPGGMLPFNNTTYFTAAQLAALNMANDAQQVPSTSLFAAGDRRANENVELLSLTTLFVRNHNRLAGQLAQQNPLNFGFTSWTDDNLYQEARRLNIAEMEIITYTGYLPSILGPNALPAYPGYNANVNAGIATEFSTVGFRFGHSLLSTTVGRDNNDGAGITDVSPNGSAVNLTEDFFRPDLLNNNHVTVNLTDLKGNPDPHTSSTVGEVLKALADGLPNETDLLLIDEVRDVLFGIPNVPGTDLAARDIQRARDHGIGTYNQVRVAYGLSAVTSFAQISSDPAVQGALRATYGILANGQDNVNAVDPFIGMLAEDHVAGADVGPTVKAILAKQFTALRNGDRYFYLNEGFTSAEANLLQQGNTLAEVIANNTSITNLQANVFFNRLKISGHVFADPDGNGTRGDTEPGLAGVTVNLLDDTGTVIASTTTDSGGGYDFTEQAGIPGTGNFTVALDPKALAAAGLAQTSAQVSQDPGTIHLSRGNLDITGQDFGVIGTKVDFLNGFATTTGLQLNGSAQVSGTRLRLTDGGGGEAGSAFTTSPVSIAQFSTFFTFQLTNPNADGFTFTIQRQAPTALGSAGGGLGYATDGSGSGAVIHNSAAIKFDLYNNQGEGTDSTGLYFNGTPPTVPAVDLSRTGINLHSGDVFEARISYDGSTLTLRIDDERTGAETEVLFKGVNLPAAIGGATAYVGFTGGTGGLTATQDILSWDFMPITSGSMAAAAAVGVGAGPAATGGVGTGGAATASGALVPTASRSADVGSGGTGMNAAAAFLDGGVPAATGGGTVATASTAPAQAPAPTVQGAVTPSAAVTAPAGNTSTTSLAVSVSADPTGGDSTGLAAENWAGMLVTNGLPS
jgi:hypothetical protein